MNFEKAIENYLKIYEVKGLLIAKNFNSNESFKR